MAFENLRFNPVLLKALAFNNNIDFASRQAEQDLLAAQRKKLLQEIAYAPQQYQNEAMKNRVYALQQGYTMDENGNFVPTPAKKAQTDAFQALLQRVQGGGAMPQQPMPQSQDISISDQGQNPLQGMYNTINDPTIAGDEGTQPLASGAGVPVVDFGDTVSASDYMPSPQGDPLQSEGVLAAMALNPDQTPNAINQAVQADIERQKMRQKERLENPEFKGQQKYLEEEAKQSVQSSYNTYNDIKTQYMADKKQSLQLSQIENLFNKGLKTGKVEEAVLPLRRWMVASGLADADTVKQVGLQEGMTALGNQLALRLRNPESGMGLTGNTSDRDVTFLLDGIETLSKSPVGNKIILEMQKASIKHGEDLYKFVAKEKAKNNGRLPKDFDQKLADWNDSNPVFSQEKADMLIKQAQEAGLKKPEQGSEGKPQFGGFKFLGIEGQ